VFFLPDSKIGFTDTIRISIELVQAYREQVSQEQQRILGDEQGVLRVRQPVFYLEDEGKLVFFGQTLMFRLPYGKSPLDFIPARLKNDQTMDLAEAIFGYTPQDKSDKREACAGRVFFSDAELTPGQDNIWFKPQSPIIKPKILSSPKPTCFQHYLTQQEPEQTQTLDHYASPPPHETVIRGHKLYWHKPGAGLVEIEESDEEKIRKAQKQYTRIKPVRENLNFTFKVRFENLRKHELGALLWALSLPGEDGKEYLHKLGMGKPLGMGSVKIKPELHISSRPKRYAILFSGNDWQRAEERQTEVDDFLNDFRNFVFDNVSREEKAHVNNYIGLQRIQSLLKMLEGNPQLPSDKLSYMDINEFKNRPVLPDPLHVSKTGGNGRSSQNNENRTQRHSVRQPSEGHKNELVLQSSQHISTSTHKAKEEKALDVGSIFIGKVSNIQKDGSVVISLPGKDIKDIDEVCALIPATHKEGKNYRPGNDARCEVIEIRTNAERKVLICKPGERKGKK